MTNHNKEQQKLETELFDENKFNDMFELAAHRQLLIQENTLLLNNFFKMLNLETLKELSEKEKMGEFIDTLMLFLEKDEQFSKTDKKRFLNGCENILFLHALMLGKKNCAKFLNQYRIDKSLHANRNFLINRINEQNYDIVESLLEYSDNVTYESSKVLKTIYVSLCRDYAFIKRLISKFNFDINAYGNLGLNDSFKGSFLHAISLMSDPEANVFFINFIKEYGSKIDFDVSFTDSQRGVDVNVLDLIINNDKLAPSEKMSRLTTILSFGELTEKQISRLSGILITEAILARYYNHPIYDALFAHQNFNSVSFSREDILNEILLIDRLESFEKIRIESNNTINPTSILLDKFFKFSSPTNLTKSHPFILWIQGKNKGNANPESFSSNTLISLIKHYKNELNDLNLGELKMPTKMSVFLRQAGIDIPEKKGIISKMFNQEKVQKEKKDMPNFETKKVEPIKEIKNNSPIKSLSFNKSLFLKVKDSEITKFVNLIVLQGEQFLKISKDKGQDYQYITIKLPKFLNTTIENYFKFSAEKPVEAKKNTLIQLKMIEKKSFDLLSNELRK